MNERRPNVLVIEDDIDCAEELAELLESYDMTMRVVHDLSSARARAAEQEFDVALVDLALGQENGLEVAQEWHREGRFVVLLTGSSPGEVDMAGFTGAPPPVMRKPVDVRELRSLIAPD